MDRAKTLLVVGEVCVDYTRPRDGLSSKMRLGGIVHAARGLWAADLDYAVGAFCPSYLVEGARDYLLAHGCQDFIWLGDVTGAPNVMVIGDPTEVSDNGYEELLREHKRVQLRDERTSLARFGRVMIFPGKFDLNGLAEQFSENATFSFDIAYDISAVQALTAFKGRVRAIMTSTSSALFASVGHAAVEGLIQAVSALSPDVLLLKENRGGSRLFELKSGHVEEIPATLGRTANSVGVGDVYSAVMHGTSAHGWVDAAWRGSRAATSYSKTTFPDDFKRDVQREGKLSTQTLKELGGTILPWHDRQRFSIYLAGPDFSYCDKRELDQTVNALRYHNFRLRRPIVEHGELPQETTNRGLLHRTYHQDLELLLACDAVFAVPLDRDPGTLVEIGIAIQAQKPIITFDPRGQNGNTMVIGGSVVYSDDLDVCLNGLFDALSKLRKQTR